MVVRVQRYPVFNPLFDEIETVERQVGQLFGDFFSRESPQYTGTYPSIDVAESDNETVLVAELPGVKKEDVKISVEKGVVTISGERKTQELPEKASWVRHEINNGKFNRAFRLPHEVDVEKIAAELTNGVLKVVLPKAEAVRPREIQIR